MFRKQVADILAKWNPLGVPDAIADDEYESYVDPILSIGPDEKVLTEYLEHIVSKTMGLNHSKENPIHSNEINTMVKNLMDMYKSRRDDTSQS